jgi:hypothetical protein
MNTSTFMFSNYNDEITLNEISTPFYKKKSVKNVFVHTTKKIRTRSLIIPHVSDIISM